MDIYDRAIQFTFRSKADAEEFLHRMRVMANKFDVVTVNDILNDRGIEKAENGLGCGYHRSEIKKIKPVRAQDGTDFWEVDFPRPSAMIRDRNGYWTTMNVITLRKAEKGG